MKHTSTVLKPSIRFHTLVILADAEDIANDKKYVHMTSFLKSIFLQNKYKRRS